eukprot:8847288-Pyramimonas_sp.AAC.1
MINIATSLRRPWDRDPPRAGRAAGDAGGSEPQAQGPDGGTSTRAGLSRVPRQLLAAGRRRSLLAGLALVMTVGTITEA